MKGKIKKLFKKPFVRNVIIIATGTAGAQFITMALSPIITRLYGPHAFGIMGTFQSITRIIVPVAALTYPIAIVLPKKDQDAKGLIRLSLIITTLISLISLIVIGLFNETIKNIFNLKDVASYLYLIPFVVFFAGFMQVVEQWLIRTKQFSINAKATFLQSIITNGAKVGIGIFYPVSAVLVVFTALKNGIKALMMILFARRLKTKNRRIVKGDDKSKGLKNLAGEYYDFPAYRAPQEFLNATSDGLPTLMLTAFFGPASAGFYTIGRTVLRFPTQFVGKSVGDVFYPRITKAANNKENMAALLKKTTLVLSGVGILPFGLVILLGPTLFSFIFGSDWSIAGEYARWIALFSYTGFMNRPSIRTLPVLNAQKFHLIYTSIMLIIRILALALGYVIFKDDLVAIALFGISGAVFNLGLIFITHKIIKKKELEFNGWR